MRMRLVAFALALLAVSAWGSPTLAQQIEAPPGQMMGPQMREGFFDPDEMMRHLGEMTAHLGTMLAEVSQWMAKGTTSPEVNQRVAAVLGEAHDLLAQVRRIIDEGRLPRARLQMIQEQMQRMEQTMRAATSGQR